MDPVGSPMFANALQFAFDKATTEGKVTIMLLGLVSLFSWTVIITKGRQIYRAHRSGKKFFAVYRATRDPLDLFNKKEDFTGAPAFDVYMAGAEELEYQLQNNPVRSRVKPAAAVELPANVGTLNQASSSVKINSASFESIRVALERAVSAQSISLEKGMIILSTAVAGGPFIGLLGTVWGVMETFSGIAKVQAASLTAMAPGVAGALIATVVGLFVAIPAMFAYNYMITSVRSITQELDTFTAELATAIEHRYVDNRSVADDIIQAFQTVFPERAEELELARA